MAVLCLLLGKGSAAIELFSMTLSQNTLFKDLHHFITPGNLFLKNVINST